MSSWVWEFCRRLPGRPRAECKLCSRILALDDSGSTMTLIRHLSGQHHIDQNSAGPAISAKQPPNQPPPTPPSPCHEWVWKHFQSLTPEAAICQLCQDILQESPRLNEATLSEHLSEEHHLADPNKPESSSPMVPKAASSPQKSPILSSPDVKTNALQHQPTVIALSEGSIVKSSPVWQYFDALPNMRVRCKKCDRILQQSNRGTTSMMRHLAGVHAIDLGTKSTQSMLARPCKPITAGRGNVWEYFDAMQEGRAQCQLCYIKVAAPRGSDQSALAAHLRDRHKIEPQALYGISPEPVSPKPEITPAAIGIWDSEDESHPPEDEPEFEPDLQELSDSDQDPLPDNDLSKSSNLRSEVWKYCLHLTSRVAQCRLCQETFPTPNGSTTSLARHLEHVHAISVTLVVQAKRKTNYKNKKLSPNALDVKEEEEEEEEAMDTHEPDQAKPSKSPTITDEHHYAKSKSSADSAMTPNEKTSSPRNQRSSVWSHFKAVGSNSARCIKCDRLYRTPNGATIYLHRHIQRHGIFESVSNSQSVEEIKAINERIEKLEEGNMHGRSWTRRYFESISKTVSRCLKCDRLYKTPNFGTTTLARHLQTFHGLSPNETDEKPMPSMPRMKKPRMGLPWEDVDDDDEEEGDQEHQENEDNHDYGNVNDDRNPLLLDNENIAEEDFNFEDENEDQDELELKKRRSWVWKHAKPSNAGMSRCRICHKAFRTKNGATTSLARHLVTFHGLCSASPPVVLSQKSTKELDDLCAKDESLPIPLSKKKCNLRLRSFLNDFYESIGDVISVCKLCQTRLRTSTRNLSQHLTKKHDIDCHKELSMDEMPNTHDGNNLNQDKGNKSAVAPSSSILETVEEILAKLVAVDGFPMDTLLKSDFITEVLAQKRLTMPATCQDLENMLIKHVEYLKIKVGEELSSMTDVDYKFSLTLYEWKTEETNIHIEITCHGHNMSWNMGIVHEMPLMTDSMIMEAVKNLVHDFGLNFHRDIVACTTNGLETLGMEHQKCLDQGIREVVSSVLFERKANQNLISEVRDVLNKLKTNSTQSNNNQFINQRALEQILPQEPQNEIGQRSWLKVLEFIESVLKPEVESRMKRLLPEKDLTYLKNLFLILDTIRIGLQALESSDVNLLLADNIVVEMLEKLEQVSIDLSQTLQDTLSTAMEQLRSHDIVSVIKYISNPKTLLDSAEQKYAFLKMSSREILERDILRFENRLFRNLHKDKVPCINRISQEMEDFENSGFLSSDLKTLRQALVTISPTCRHRGHPQQQRPQLNHTPSTQLEDALAFLKGYYDQRN